MSLVTLLSQAYQQARDSASSSVDNWLLAALDPPFMAQSYLQIRQSYAQQAKSIRASLAAWNAQIARSGGGSSSSGGWVQNFGVQAEQLRQKTLQRFIDETRDALAWTSFYEDNNVRGISETTTTSLPQYRKELYQQLSNLVDTSIRTVFQAQMANLEKSTLQKLQEQLMQLSSSATSSSSATTTTTASSSSSGTESPNEPKAAMRSVALSFDMIMDTLEVPSLGLTKAKASHAMSVQLANAVEAFPSSPRMQLKRLGQIQKTTSKQQQKRKPNERAIDVGLDLVAMLRPDGYGSFQGFCGYQLGGNSITFGVHNDADDPQVIAQFGGVRPPLLRVQPKLRVDVEL